jgi:Arc/MetJ family transcription regulator
MQIELDDKLVAQIDELRGPKGRTAFVRSAIERAVREELRWSEIAAAAGAIESHGHDWDADPAEWVRRQRRAEAVEEGRAQVLTSTRSTARAIGTPGR